MELGQGSIRDVLSGDRQYRIPLYQRPYSWQRADWQTLWVDVLTQYQTVVGVYAETDDDDERNDRMARIAKHYLGALVQANPSAVGMTKVSVVDGQQRLSTVSVLLGAVRDTWRRRLARSHASEDEIAALNARMSRAYLTNENHPPQDAARLMLQEADQRAFELIRDAERPTARIDFQGLGLAPGESDLLFRAYNYFFAEMNRRAPLQSASHLERFRHLFPLDPDILEVALVDRVYVITIEVGQQDDVNAIFESLNTKGAISSRLTCSRTTCSWHSAQRRPR